MSTLRRVATNGIELDVIEAGDLDAPLVVLSHGFPECAYSWRHQIEPLAAAGYHVLAPDQRGYGRSSAPAEVDAYGVRELSGDLLGLLDGAGVEDAVFVGHDWGALLVWDLARMHPERVRAIVAASVPLTLWPARPTDVMRHMYGDRFFYILYFQEVGPAEAELGADVARTMRLVLHSASGDRVGLGTEPANAELPPMEGTGFLDLIERAGPMPAGLPSWLTPADLATYVDRFEASGFFGPLSWYRNLDANHEVVHRFPPSRIDMPVAFIAGTHDVVIRSRPGYVDVMTSALTDLRATVMLDGVGHWTQQEAPAEFNRAVLDFLGGLDAARH